MKNFWNDLKKPIFCLAPMADVTDCAFRKMIAHHGKPDIFWTEFVSADGLAHPEAREKLLIDLKYSETEHPIVAQIFGSNADNIREASALCKKLGFDGIDINMGCPDRLIEKQGSGAAMIKTPAKAREIIRAAKEGAGGLPVSVKTRIGYNKNEIDKWVSELLSEDIAALTVHLRTRKEMSNVPAHWDLMKSVIEIRNKINPKILILGNGDAESVADAKNKIEETGCDGVMLGRAIFGNPWLFAGRTPSLKEKLEVMIEHTKLFEELLGGLKNFAIMKKHYKAYVNGFDGAKELRMKLMEAENASEVASITNDFLAQI
ncbi:MAG: tRNA-dihydrouridine synthase [Candidatus Paceibacterota bacterium]|jgi:nifR3 family TIM-barrel protein